jgi:hypothetical protein
MRYLKVLGKIITGLIITLIVVFIVTSFVFSCLWDSHSVNSIEEARLLLKQHGSEEHKLILNECRTLMITGEKVLFKANEVPSNLKLLSPEYLRASEYSCELNLYKAPGKGIGYWVSERNGKYELSWADHFVSWDSHLITIE